jgi:hypothetical protein
MCVCRGCRRPGQRNFIEWLRRQPAHAAPRSHAEAMLGKTHGRMHDLADLEREYYGKLVSPELIIHFEHEKCWEVPGLIAVEWR